MSYRVFARKYRPQTFPEVVGQEHITRTLQNAIRTNRIAQAYLFVGPRGIGKTSTARILAKALNCQKGTSPDPCGVCDSCIEIAEGISLDVFEIDGASNNSVDNIRDLREKALYAPARGPFKIFLIDEVHMLSIGAFNALLKILEEPPPHVKFIFATTEAQKVPATITSRCQRFDLRRIPDELIARHLLMIAQKENFVLEPAAADAIARGANGGMRDAESMLDQLVAFCGNSITVSDVHEVFGFTPQETINQLLGAILSGDVTGPLATIASLDEAGKDLGWVISDLIDRLRDILVARATGKSDDPLSASAALVSREKLLELLEHFAEAESRLRWATDKRMQADVAVIKAVHILEQSSLSDVLETIASLRDGQPVPHRAAPSVPAAPSEPKPANLSSPKVASPHKPTPAGATNPSETNPGAKAETDFVPPRAPSSVPTVSSPLPTASVPASQASPAGIWSNIAAKLSAESPFKFCWLETGVFQTISEGRVIVEFPEEQRSCAESIFWQDSQKILDAELSTAFGQPLRFHPEFTTSPLTTDEAQPASSEQPDSQPTNESPTAPATPVDHKASESPSSAAEPSEEERMKEFLEDPLIQEALRVFEAELRLAPDKK